MFKFMRGCTKIYVIVLLACVLVNSAWAKEYKYFSIDLIEGWHEYKPQQLNDRGTYVTVLSNQTLDTAITLAATKNSADLTTEQLIANAQSIVLRMQLQGINFTTANFDEQQGVFVAAGFDKNQEQWRVVMTQDNQVLYTVLFNGAKVDEAGQILNSLKSLAN